MSLSVTIPTSSLPSDSLRPSDQRFHTRVHTETQACVQGQAFIILEITANQRAIQGTVTECIQDGPWKYHCLYLCICIYIRSAHQPRVTSSSPGCSCHILEISGHTLWLLVFFLHVPEAHIHLRQVRIRPLLKPPLERTAFLTTCRPASSERIMMLEYPLCNGTVALS